MRARFGPVSRDRGRTCVGNGIGQKGQQLRTEISLKQGAIEDFIRFNRMGKALCVEGVGNGAKLKVFLRDALFIQFDPEEFCPIRDQRLHRNPAGRLVV